VVTVWLVWALARTAGLPPSVSLVATAMYAVEPLAIVFTARILAETLFTCVIAALSLALARWVRRGRRTDILAAGLLLAFGALVRPVLYYAPPVLALVVLAMAVRRKPLRPALVDALLLLGIAALPIAAWRVRNAEIAGYDAFSGIADVNLRFYRAASLVARRTHTSREAVVATWGGYAFLDSLTASGYSARGHERSERLKALRAAAIPILAHDPVAVAQDAVRGGALTLAGPGGAEWVAVLGLTDSRPLLLTAALAAYLLLLWSAVALGAWLGWRELGALVPTLVLGTYLILISAGPEGYSRFRHPIMPTLCIVGALGLVRLRASVERPAEGPQS